MPLRRKKNFSLKKIAIIAVILILLVLMIISFAPVQNITEVVLA